MLCKPVYLQQATGSVEKIGLPQAYIASKWKQNLIGSYKIFISKHQRSLTCFWRLLRSQSPGQWGATASDPYCLASSPKNARDRPRNEYVDHVMLFQWKRNEELMVVWQTWRNKDSICLKGRARQVLWRAETPMGLAPFQKSPNEVWDTARVVKEVVRKGACFMLFRPRQQQPESISLHSFNSCTFTKHSL